MKEADPGKRITMVWLFVAVDTDGDEGLPAFMVKGTMMPMVASDERRRDILLEEARRIVRLVPGTKIEVRRFDGPFEVEAVIK